MNVVSISVRVAQAINQWEDFVCTETYDAEPMRRSYKYMSIAQLNQLRRFHNISMSYRLNNLLLASINDEYGVIIQVARYEEVLLKLNDVRYPLSTEFVLLFLVNLKIS
jgi:hypothetical protein